MVVSDPRPRRACGRTWAQRLKTTKTSTERTGAAYEEAQGPRISIAPQLNRTRKQIFSCCLSTLSNLPAGSALCTANSAGLARCNFSLLLAPILVVLLFACLASARLLRSRHVRASRASNEIAASRLEGDRRSSGSTVLRDCVAGAEVREHG